MIEIRKDALISTCGAYRYWLNRVWEDAKVRLPFIMLNPSTADASEDDPTIRRCMGFARDNGFGGIIVMNLFAYRATQPSDMKRSPDPVGPHNDGHLRDLFGYARGNDAPIIAAWGTHGTHRGRDRRVRHLAAEAGIKLSCLGRSKGGHPKHPLYLAASSPIEAL